MIRFKERIEACLDSDNLDAVMEEASKSRISFSAFTKLRHLLIEKYRILKKKSLIPVQITVESFMNNVEMSSQFSLPKQS